MLLSFLEGTMSLLAFISGLSPLGWVLFLAGAVLAAYAVNRFIDWVRTDPDLVGVTWQVATGTIVRKEERPGELIPTSTESWNSFDAAPTAEVWCMNYIPGPPDFRLSIAVSGRGEAWYSCSRTEYETNVVGGTINVRWAVGCVSQRLHIAQAWH